MSFYFFYFLPGHTPTQPKQRSKTTGPFRWAPKFPSSPNRWLQLCPWLTQPLPCSPRRSSSTPCRPPCCLWSKQPRSASSQRPLQVWASDKCVCHLESHIYCCVRRLVVNFVNRETKTVSLHPPHEHHIFYQVTNRGYCWLTVESVPFQMIKSNNWLYLK